MRARRTYSERRAWTAPAGYGLAADKPEAGFYKIKMGQDGVRRAVRLVYGPPNDPVTGEPLDRSWRWMAYLDDGSLRDFNTIWPACAKHPIDEAEWKRCCARDAWAKQHAPDSAYADPTKRHDPLTSPLLW